MILSSIDPMHITAAISRTSRVLPAALLALLLCPIALSQSTNAPAATETELYRKLKTLPNVVEVRPTQGGSQTSRESYEVMFEQPLDHQNPNGEKFQQRFFVVHSDYAKPVLLGTEGYAARGTSGGELQRILDGNQVT